MKKTLLLVTPHFPPSTLAGVHRARHLAKHLPAHGWRPIVVRVDERFYTETGDPALAALVPAEVDQVRVRALPARFTRAFGVGDIGLRGYGEIRRALARLTGEYKPAALMITGFPFYPMLLAGWAKQRLNLPVILDFQDPWASNAPWSGPIWSKRGLSHRLSRVLEPRAVRHAAFITSVSQTQNDEMAARYAWMDRERMAAIPIGGDPEDFEALRAAGRSSLLDPARLNLSYVGTCLPRAGPLMRAVLRAAGALRAASPQLSSRLRFNFIGTSNQPDGHGRYSLRGIAEQEGVADLVAETPQRIPYLDALGVLTQSRGLLLIGSDQPHYTASKIYPALMSGTPFVSLFHANSSAHAILTRAGGGRTFAFREPAELEALVPELTEGLRVLAQEPERMGRAAAEAYADFTAAAVAGAFANVLDRAASAN